MRIIQRDSANLATVAILAFAVAGTAAGQGTPSANDSTGGPSEFALRSSGSLSVIQTRPQGALGKNIGLGYGVNGAYLFRIDRAGILSLRADIGAVAYGSESKRSAFSETVGGRVQVNVRTTNYIVPMSVGPQLTWPTGIVRPYVNVGIGGQAFFTDSQVDQTDGGSAVASTTNQSAIAAAWTTGAGVYMPIHTGKTNVQLDIGIQYLNGGNSRYLAPGSIVDLPGGQIKVSPLESTTHLVVVRIGARIGL